MEQETPRALLYINSCKLCQFETEKMSSRECFARCIIYTMNLNQFGFNFQLYGLEHQDLKSRNLVKLTIFNRCQKFCSTTSKFPVVGLDLNACQQACYQHQEPCVNKCNQKASIHAGGLSNKILYEDGKEATRKYFYKCVWSSCKLTMKDLST